MARPTDPTDNFLSPKIFQYSTSDPRGSVQITDVHSSSLTLEGFGCCTLIEKQWDCVHDFHLFFFCTFVAPCIPPFLFLCIDIPRAYTRLYYSSIPLELFSWTMNYKGYILGAVSLPLVFFVPPTPTLTLDDAFLLGQ